MTKECHQVHIKDPNKLNLIGKWCPIELNFAARNPKDTKKNLQDTQVVAKGTQTEPKGTPMDLKSSAECSQRHPKALKEHLKTIDSAREGYQNHENYVFDTPLERNRWF